MAVGTCRQSVMVIGTLSLTGNPEARLNAFLASRGSDGSQFESSFVM
jgi:hypothetical protein